MQRGEFNFPVLFLTHSIAIIECLEPGILTILRCDVFIQVVGAAFHSGRS